MSDDAAIRFIGSIVILLVINLAWIGGGAWVARRFGWTGRWAIYKGQLVIWAPVALMIFILLFWSGAFNG